MSGIKRFDGSNFTDSTAQRFDGSAWQALTIAKRYDGSEWVDLIEAETAYQDPITITSGGTYTGNYQSTDSDTPAITVATTEAVILQDMNVRHAGYGVTYGVDSSNITLKNSTFTAIEPTYAQADQQSVNLYMPDSLIVEHNLFKYGHGVLVNGGRALSNELRVSYNQFIDISRRSASSGLVGAVHLDKVYAPGAKILWNRISNHYGQSETEDVFGITNTKGADGNRIVFAHNLVNGSYPRSGDGSGFTGSAFDFGDLGGAYMLAHDNYATNYTNNGFMIPSGTDVHLRDCIAVYDGIADNGQRVSSTFGNGFTTYHPSDYPADNNIGMADTRSAHRRWTGSDWQRSDYYLPYGTNSNNASLSDANSSAKQAVIDEFEQSVAANGVTIGPLS
jgi:hypothetical protein